MPTFRFFPLALALLVPLVSPCVQAAEPLVPIAAFFENPKMRAAKISPDGKRVAILFNNAATKGYDQLGVIDLANNSIKVAAGFGEADVNQFYWINSGRLVYNSADKTMAPGRERLGTGLYAVNADGTAQRQLVSVGESFVTNGKQPGREILPSNTFLLGQDSKQDGNVVYAVQAEFAADDSLDRLELIRLDTLSATYEYIRGPAGRVHNWMLDAQGRPALAVTVEADWATMHYLDPKTGAWRRLGTQNIYLNDDDAIEPLGFSPEGELFVLNRRQRDTLAPFRYDLATARVVGQPLVNMPDYDFDGELVESGGKLVGIRYVADGQGTVWFDPALKQLQATVDKLLPGRVNRLSVGVRSQTPHALVESWSDRQPRQFFVFNRDTGKLSKLGEQHPDVNPARMASLDLVKITARDGEPVPTWVSIPAGSTGKKMPMVVLVHGGPWVRGGEWDWDAQRQFLASRGYVVLEPEYRGSTGYGERHFRAGLKQWGLAMQDDVADATRWAIAEGIADPERICIAGASYGGYATLMGLIRDPALYKCGIDWVGVTDIELMYNGHWTGDSDMSDAYKRYGMPVLVGDRVKDAAQFAATSPLKQAARVTQPLLLAYGGVDQRVPIFHGRKFVDAVRETNKQVEWVVYDHEGHGWKLVETRLDFWGRVEKFLQRQIGTPAR